ncbi:MAG TPA: alkaline phosphatase family protein [Isosphaeraceae bacterium]|nr:alkaline phosphatase family protein [Isosphaeraceae bacterium]
MPFLLQLTTALVVFFVIGLPAYAQEARPAPVSRNVVLVTTDGLRWQEVFRGADASLLNQKDGGAADPEALRQVFWRETPEARREALMPFLWTTVAHKGQIFGNRDKKSPARVTNGKNFSYPGYNELFTGFPDPRINSNAKRPNPNETVLEWLHRKPAFRGKVAAVASWDTFPFILNVERSGLSVNAGWVPFDGALLSESQTLLNRVMSQSVRQWPDSRNDVFTFAVALESLRRDKPRVLYIGLDDTDEYAHAGRYDNYLRAAQNADNALKTLWDELEAQPQYRGTTTLIFTTDHGRGNPPQGWRSHGANVEGSDAIWVAVLGPDTPALGERSDTETVTQSQVAATLAALLGENYNADVPQAAAPIAEVVRPSGPAPGVAPAAAPVPAQPLWRIAFCSCASQAQPQPIWDAVLATRPEPLLMLGDNIYADTEDMGEMRAKYAQLAAMPGFKALREKVPVLPSSTSRRAGSIKGPSHGGHSR